ncbi:hypothetical protein D3Z33_06850 [Senegalia massiliensis]|uniref:Uncharacterized protein n=1 Tax=Senegalia massiliensis TaxID=1720316 RepID=A0A845QZG1_9CLOT|nr:hypothetical protein [Senegalia massiliensis]
MFNKEKMIYLSDLLFYIFLIIIVSLNNNERIKDIPYVYMALRLVFTGLNAYVIIKIIKLLKNTFKDSQKKPFIKFIYSILGVFLILLMLFLFIENIIHII